MKEARSHGAEYRPEIDGLRAVAVLSVVFYHAEIQVAGKDFFVGGFFGVDIFFVISGYLITRLVLAEISATGSFGFLRFYERRIRRIFPMLIVMIMTVSPFAWIYLWPTDFRQFTASAGAAIVFVSNFFFSVELADYEADNALLLPLLHTWSLGIEEQFYLAFPFLLFLTSKVRRSLILPSLCAVTVLSLFFALWWESREPILNFYSPLSRVWELSTGSMLAYFELERNSRTRKPHFGALSTLGLLMIAFSVVIATRYQQVDHPGLITLLPVIGVALIVFFSSDRDLVGKLLSSKPMVAVGLISYSLYLWHFPILAIMRNAKTQLTTVDKSAAILLAVSLSTISYQWVEKKFRNANLISTKLLWSSTVSGIILVSSMSILVIQTHFLPRPDLDEAFVILANTDNPPEADSFETVYDYRPKLDDRRSILVIGNSHGRDLFWALKASYLDRDYQLLIASPAMKTKTMNYTITCFLSFLSKQETVCRGQQFGPNLALQYEVSDVVLLAQKWDEPEYVAMVPDLIRRLIADEKKVILIGSTPESREFGLRELSSFDNFLDSYKRLPSQQELIELERDFFNDYERDQILVNEQLQSYVAASASQDVSFASRADFMCNVRERRCSLYFPDRRVKVLSDGEHTTYQGKIELGKEITRIKWLSEDLHRWFGRENHLEIWE